MIGTGSVPTSMSTSAVEVAVAVAPAAVSTVASREEEAARVVAADAVGIVASSAASECSGLKGPVLRPHPTRIHRRWWGVCYYIHESDRQPGPRKPSTRGCLHGERGTQLVSARWPTRLCALNPGAYLSRGCDESLVVPPQGATTECALALFWSILCGCTPLTSQAVSLTWDPGDVPEPLKPVVVNIKYVV